jgi:hypothetical protein
MKEEASLGDDAEPQHYEGRDCQQPAQDVRCVVKDHAYAKHERETLTAVTEARAKVGAIQVPKNIIEDPKAFSAKMDSVYKDAADRIGADLIAQARNFS